MYKIMFSDLDETLLVNHHVPDFNVETILKARKKGLKFVPCTGRANYMINEIIDELDANKENEYSICFNGGLIIENKDNKVLYFNGLGYDYAKLFFDYASKLDVCVLVFTTKCCHIFNPDKEEIERKKTQKAPFEVHDNFDISILKDESIAKMLYEKRDMDVLRKIVDNMPDDLKKLASISFSSNRYIEISALNVNKGNGMRFLADYLNVDINDTIGIGDNYNDVDMIKTAGLGCVVNCAPDDVKELGDYVTNNNYDEGAVKEVIEKFILEDK